MQLPVQSLPYLKTLLLQLASKRSSIGVSFANFFLAVHFGSCLCDAGSCGLNQPQEAGVDEPMKRRALGPCGTPWARGRVGRGREYRREPGAAEASVASGASGPGNGAGGGGGAWGSVSDASPGRSRNLANPCGSCRTRPWPRGGSGGGAWLA